MTNNYRESIKIIIAIATFFISFNFPLSWNSSKPNQFLAVADNLESAIDTNELNLLKLGVPPFKQNAPGNINLKPSPVNLTLLSATPNQITDTDAWFSRNNLALPTYKISNPFRQEFGVTPSRFPARFKDNILVKAIESDKQDFLIYGRNFAENRYLLIYDRDTDKIVRGYDFSNYVHSSSYVPEDRKFINQTLNWVVPEENILYFSHSHNTYAKSSHGMNAYLTALDLDTNQILWRSQPLVCNARNFIIIDSVIICGYGFTAEPDYLYLIDKNTGEILQQIQLKTAPEFIIPQEDKLYVRTYNTDYVFSIQR